MPLQLFTSNRLEILAELLADKIASQPLSPFEEEIIVVQSRGMARWLSIWLAEQNGILGNTSFPFPNIVINNIFKKLFPDDADQGFSKELATWHIMHVLRKMQDQKIFAKVAAYLNDDNDLKRLQLSSRIADLFDQYTVYRPDLIKAWDSGGGNDWQAVLWGALKEFFPGRHRADLQHDTIIKLEEKEILLQELPPRLAVFGVSSLPPYHIDIFHSLSKQIEVSFYLLNPCELYWGDIVSDREIAHISRKEQMSEEELYLTKGNSILAATGQQGRDFFEMLHNLGAVEFTHFVEGTGKTLLSSIQNDILHLYEPEADSAGNSVQVVNHADQSIAIHSCHSPMREVEVLKDQLLGIFSENQTIEPRDVIVMVPDVELYSPLIQAVFAEHQGEHNIPFSIADRSMRSEGRFIELFLSLIKLTTSRYGVNQVREIIARPVFYKKFGIQEQDLVVIDRWLNDTGIRWGIDAQRKKKVNLPEIYENTWLYGKDRMLLGYAMAGKGEFLFENILPFDNIEGSEAQILGSLVLGLETLFEQTEKLEGCYSLSHWAAMLQDMLATCFHQESIPDYELQLVQNCLGKMVDHAQQTNFSEELSVEAVHAYLVSALEHETSPSGFITGGVTFCEMLPMRAIPFQVVCMLGLNDKEFPRQDNIFSFNKMAQERRPGDRSLRLEDRYIFLEALLSAREYLYVSYVGQSITDDNKYQPAVPVCELIEYVKRNYKVTSGNIEDHIHTYHPLQPFSPQYFTNNTKLFSFSKIHFEAAAAVGGEVGSVPPLVGNKLPEPDESFKRMELSQLLSFFAHPVRHFCQKRLGIFVTEQDMTLEDKELFELGGLESYFLKETLLNHALKSEQIAARYPLIKASGKLPHGSLGKVVFDNICQEVTGCADSFRNMLKQEMPPLDFDLQYGGFQVNGRLDNIHAGGLVTFRCGKISGKELLQHWLRHLVLNLSATASLPLQSTLAGINGLYCFQALSNAKEIFNDLLQIYWQGLSEPLPLFVKSSYAYAQAIYKGKSEDVALHEAAMQWVGNEFRQLPGEGENVYINMSFRGTMPFDKRFCDVSRRVFLPLLAHIERGQG